MATFTLEELDKLPAQEPSEWIVYQMFKTKTKRPHCILGYAESGKSTLGIQLVVAVSQGKPFLNRETLKSKCILWRNEENELDTLSDFKKAKAQLDGNGNITVMFQMPAEDNFAQLKQTLEYTKDVRLVVIETFMDFFNLNDVSDNDEERRAMAQFTTEVASVYANCCFIFLHQFNKSNGNVDVTKQRSIFRIMGGSAFAQGTSTKIYLSQVSDVDTRRVVSVTVRRGMNIEPTYLVFDPNTLTSTLGMTLKGEMLTRKEEKKKTEKVNLDQLIIQYLYEHPGTPKWTVAKVLGNDRVAAARIDALIEAGALRIKIDAGESHAMKLYVTEVPKENIVASAVTVPMEDAADDDAKFIQEEMGKGAVYVAG